MNEYTSSAKRTRFQQVTEQEGLLPDRPPLLHRDSEWTIGSDYSDDAVHNTLNAWQGAALLTADCLGTGLLALPNDIHTLGTTVGLTFLLLNLPINFYAGYILHKTAAAIEDEQELQNRVYSESFDRDYQAISTSSIAESHNNLHHDTATNDCIGMANAVFRSKYCTRIIMFVYYVNIFLVLGNYILVMSHAVGESHICIPVVGAVAAIAMFVVSQSRTMALLGRTASIVSLTALLIVVLQCLYAVWRLNHALPVVPPAIPTLPEDSMLQVLRQCSALGSIGFAVGSQKLFLNIRHELRDRSKAPKTLGIALTAFGTCYLLLCLAAGPNPPGFLLDAIPIGSSSRRVAGVLLCMHVVVSYAINSQAICSSMDRLVWYKLLKDFRFSENAVIRWMLLTGCVCATAYLVANSIPFFTDLVSFIGAVTSVPLTLLLPAVFWRQHIGVPLLWPTWKSVTSFGLTYFSIVFMVAATIGSLYSIIVDWESHGAPFACNG